MFFYNYHVEKTGDIEAAEKILVMSRDAGYVTTKMYNSALRAYAKADLRGFFIYIFIFYKNIFSCSKFT